MEESGSENFVIFACVLNRKKSQRALNRSTEFNIMNIITKVTFIVSKCTNWMKSQNPRVGVEMNVHIFRTHTHTHTITSHFQRKCRPTMECQIVSNYIACEIERERVSILISKRNINAIYLWEKEVFVCQSELRFGCDRKFLLVLFQCLPLIMMAGRSSYVDS